MAKIDSLFDKMIEQGGSDLHLEQGQLPKLRLHGKLVDIDGHDALTAEYLEDILKEIALDDKWDMFDSTGDTDFAYSYEQAGARFRANYFRHFDGIGAIFRIIPSKILTLDDLGMPDTLKNFGEFTSGLVLVTGPTGSGKSTTLAAIINHINENYRKKIITIEEPVEFMHPSKSCIISHREVHLDTKSFASGLKGSIKSDANIILVGEMRDQETIELAMTAAEMGILVFGTLHTNCAAKTIDRIIDVFPAKKKNQIRAVLANTLKAIVAQQLLKSPDGSRRHAAYEILLESRGLAPIIMSGETVRLTSEIQMNKEAGMILMDDCLRQLVADGKVSKDDAYMKALDKEAFAASVS